MVYMWFIYIKNHINPTIEMFTESDRFPQVSQRSCTEKITSQNTSKPETTLDISQFQGQYANLFPKWDMG